MPEMNMAKSGQPLMGFSDVMTQNFEQTDAAHLKKKIKGYLEKNIAAANEFMRRLSEAKDVQSFWRIQIDFMQRQRKMLSTQMKDLKTATTSVTGAFKNIASNRENSTSDPPTDALRSRDQELLESARASIDESWELIARVNSMIIPTWR
jgi:hypothetical protein